MYVENVRKALENLKGREYEAFAFELRLVFAERYKKHIKPATLKDRIDNFVNGTVTPNLETFEALLITFDNIAIRGGIKALTNDSIHYPNSWRFLLLRITEDQPLPDYINRHLEDKEVLTQIKGCFYNTIGYCRSADKDKFYNNLIYFNQFLRMSF